jgi:hypothetical protein
MAIGERDRFPRAIRGGGNGRAGLRRSELPSGFRGSEGPIRRGWRCRPLGSCGHPLPPALRVEDVNDDAIGTRQRKGPHLGRPVLGKEPDLDAPGSLHRLDCPQNPMPRLDRTDAGGQDSPRYDDPQAVPPRVANGPFQRTRRVQHHPGVCRIAPDAEPEDGSIRARGREGRHPAGGPFTRRNGEENGSHQDRRKPDAHLGSFSLDLTGPHSGFPWSSAALL